MRLALSALFLAASCAPLFPGVPVALEGEEQAVWSIWHDSYRREDKPPLVRWVLPERQTCAINGKGGFKTPLGACREGLTLSPLEVSVAWHGEESFSWTALAHELCHADQARQGVIDPLHLTAAFGAGGAVEQANAHLVEQGL